MSSWAVAVGCCFISKEFYFFLFLSLRRRKPSVPYKLFASFVDFKQFFLLAFKCNKCCYRRVPIGLHSWHLALSANDVIAVGENGHQHCRHKKWSYGQILVNGYFKLARAHQCCVLSLLSAFVTCLSLRFVKFLAPLLLLATCAHNSDQHIFPVVYTPSPIPA